MASKATLAHIRHRLDQRERNVKHPDTLAIIRVARLLCDEVEAHEAERAAAFAPGPPHVWDEKIREMDAARRAREEMEL